MSFNITVTESFNGSEVPEEFLRFQFRHGDEYNPAAERFPTSLTRSSPLREIEKGEELFMNYLAAVNVYDWKNSVSILRDQCNNGATGVASTDEQEV
jgi:hypothetical protein